MCPGLSRPHAESTPAGTNLVYSLPVRFLGWLERRGNILVPAGLFLGLAWQELAALARPFVAPAVIILLAATVLRLELRPILTLLKTPGRLMLVFCWLLFVCPVVVWAGISLFDPPSYLKTPMLLAASSPTLISLPAIALLLGLDAPLALVIMVGSSLLQPIVQPTLALALIGIDLHISVVALMLRLAFILGAALGIAALIHVWTGHVQIKKLRQAIGGVAILMLMIFSIGIMDGLATQVLYNPTRVLCFIVAAFVLNIALQAFSIAVFCWPAYWGFSTQQGLAASLASGNRNLATLVAALGPSADPDLFLFLACNGFPLYLLPLLAGPLHRALLLRKEKPPSLAGSPPRS